MENIVDFRDPKSDHRTGKQKRFWQFTKSLKKDSGVATKVTIVTVRQLLWNLNPQIACGIDFIHTRLLKDMADETPPYSQ